MSLRRLRSPLFKLGIFLISLCVIAPLGNAFWEFFDTGSMTIDRKAWISIKDHWLPIGGVVAIWAMFYGLAWWDEHRYIDLVAFGKNVGATVKRVRDLKIGLDVVVP